MNNTDEQKQVADKPKDIRRAIFIFYLSAFIGFVSLVLNPALKAAHPIEIVFLAIGCCFTIFLIAQVSNRRNWARVTLLILFLIGIPFLLPRHIEDFGLTPLTAILDIVIFILQAPALFLSFTSDSDAWFSLQMKK
jgi:hypothetical protein